jgi:hypothetical protein
VNAGPPATAEFGLRLLTEGTGFGAVTVNVTGFEVRLLGPGLNTVTLRCPAVAMSPAGIAAVSLVPLAKVVARGDPCQRTDEVEIKPEPLTVSVNPGSPAAAELGSILEITGSGVLMVKVTGFEPTPPLLKTLIMAVPGRAMSLAVMVAVRLVGLLNLVSRPDPFQRSWEVMVNPEPVTARAKVSPPALAEVGLILLITGV